MTELPHRDIARALLLDPENRLFLICYEAVRDLDPARPGRRDFWFPPGGGREEGESFEEAVRRELQEETGLTEIDLGPWIGRFEAPFTLFRTPRFAHERHYLVRSPTAEVDTSQLAETEQNPVLDARWWTIEELRALDAPVLPRGFVPLYERVLRGDLPAAPVDLA